MKENGYDIAKIGQMRDVAAEEFGAYRASSEGPSQAEQDMAVTDYTCQDKAHLLSAVQGAFKRSAGKWMVENEALLLERHEQLQEALKKSNAIIAGDYSYETYLSEHPAAESQQ